MAIDTAGVYYIKNTVNGKLYVGSSVNMRNRWRRHRSDLRWGRHNNPKLLSAWNKYGEAAFEFGVLEYVTVAESLRVREEHFRVTLNAAYNCLSALAGGVGGRVSRTTGRTLTAEHRARISAGITGHTVSDETRRKIGEASRQRRHTAATRARLSEAGRDRTQSEETRAKIRAACLGRSKNCGAANPRYDHAVYCFGHSSGQCFTGTRQAFIREMGLSPGMVSDMVRGKRQTVNGWTLKDKDFVGEAAALL